MQPSTDTDPPCQEKNAPGFTAFERLCRIQMLILQADLDPQELAVLSEVWARSVGFGKRGTYLGTRQIADARKMARSTVCDVLNRLELHRMITRTRGRHRTWLEIDFEGMGDMALGTKGRTSKEKIQEGVRQADSEVSGTRTAGNLNQVEAEPEVCVQQVARRMSTLTDYDLKHTNRRVTGGTLARTWAAVWHRSGFAVTTTLSELSRKQQGQLGHLKSPWKWEEKELHFFLAWVVSDWKNVIAELTWLKSPPEQPSPGFVLAMSGPLMDLWAAKVRYDFASDMSNDRLERLMAGGMKEGEALAVVTRVADEVVRPRQQEPAPRSSEAAWGTRPPKKWRSR